mgnify:CR=1 FL=1
MNCTVFDLQTMSIFRFAFEPLEMSPSRDLLETISLAESNIRLEQTTVNNRTVPVSLCSASTSLPTYIIK